MQLVGERGPVPRRGSCAAEGVAPAGALHRARHRLAAGSEHDQRAARWRGCGQAACERRA
eukprot:358637-Chlamydomonas_euryale.AAC.3